jgi:soluble lytic murein transglycosylase-like protein
LIRTESDFNLDFTLFKEVLGLMQLKPGSARDLAVMITYDI